jgi:hypothetical protein
MFLPIRPTFIPFYAPQQHQPPRVTQRRFWNSPDRCRPRRSCVGFLRSWSDLVDGKCTARLSAETRNERLEPLGSHGFETRLAGCRSGVKIKEGSDISFVGSGDGIAFVDEGEEERFSKERVCRFG